MWNRRPSIAEPESPPAPAPVDTSERASATAIVLRSVPFESHTYTHYQLALLVTLPDSEVEEVLRYSSSGGGDTALAEKGDEVTVSLYRHSPDSKWIVQGLSIDFDIDAEKAKLARLSAG